jgi:pimeloyl-ACP methyl ester carboxylesterase
LHRDIAHSALVVAPRVGHMVHYAVPGLIVEAIDQMSAG